MKRIVLLTLGLTATIQLSSQTPVTTASGLQYTVTQPGSGDLAKPRQYIQFYYVGRLSDGTVFLDGHTAGEPAVIQMGERSGFPKGLIEGVSLFPPGAKATLTLPPAIAYGDKSVPQLKIAANATLIYDVEILGVKSQKLTDILWEDYQAGGIDQLSRHFSELKAANFPDIATWSNQLNYFGYGYLYQLNRPADAILIFQLNCDLYPKNADIRDSLAEAYFVAGDRTQAQRELEAVLAMDSTVKNSETMLGLIEASPDSPSRLERLQKLLRSAGTFGSPPFDKMPPNYPFLQQQLDAYLADPAATPEMKGKQAESFLMLAQRSKAIDLDKFFAKYLASTDQAIRDGAQRAKDAPEKARLTREAAKKAREDAQNKTVVIKFTSLDGREVDTTKLKGKVLLVDFWATWCGPCIEEIPNVVASYRKYHGKGFEVVGITLDRANKPEKEILEFCAKNGMQWPQCFDVKRGDQTFANQFGVEAIPAMLLLDQNGVIVSTNARGPKLEQEVRRLLGLPSMQDHASK